MLGCVCVRDLCGEGWVQVQSGSSVEVTISLGPLSILCDYLCFITFIHRAQSYYIVPRQTHTTHDSLPQQLIHNVVKRPGIQNLHFLSFFCLCGTFSHLHLMHSVGALWKQLDISFACGFNILMLDILIWPPPSAISACLSEEPITLWEAKALCQLSLSIWGGEAFHESNCSCRDSDNSLVEVWLLAPPVGQLQ